jgi:serine/threonine protein kinase
MPAIRNAATAHGFTDYLPFDERSDLFSLGAILYEALTGERPKRAPRAEIARRLTVIRPGLPRSVRETVCSLLAESPGKRPASAEQVLDALEPARVYRSAGEGLVPWADTLPFPLASILWHFEAEPDVLLHAARAEGIDQGSLPDFLSNAWILRTAWPLVPATMWPSIQDCSLSARS